MCVNNRVSYTCDAFNITLSVASLCMQLGLVDGIVTEDSDALLFGAETVYRNIFSDKKYVEVSSADLLLTIVIYPS